MGIVPRSISRRVVFKVLLANRADLNAFVFMLPSEPRVGAQYVASECFFRFVYHHFEQLILIEHRIEKAVISLL